jgi:hypothetical protein
LLLRKGLRQLKTVQADVVLIDPQFAPKVLATVTAIGTLPSILLAYRHGYVLEPGTESVEEKNRAALGSRPAAAWAERPQAISHSV